MQDITRQLERRRQVQERLPPLETIVRGSVFTRHLRCGKPTCRCARGRGARHRATYLSVSFGGGRTVQISSLRVPDSPENDQTFGRPKTARRRAGYPQARIVALMVLRSHVLAGFALGPWHVGELTLAASLWPQLPEASLTILDRGFLSYLLFHQIQAGGPQRHWLARAKKNLRWQVRPRPGPHASLGGLPRPPNLRRAHPELPDTLPAPAIRYHRRGFRPQTPPPSLLAPALYPADEIVELYHERRELEIGVDEVKTHTLERQEALRSRAPERVRQEIWGLAIGYNLIRLGI